jgi:hypothetical protein
MAESATALNYQGNASSSDLTADGTAVTLGSGQSVTIAGYDLTGGQAECQLGRGANQPSGSSEQGFVDTTYTLTSAQVAAGSLMGA